ncbi:helix-turn-helix domain-containing protein [Shouchella hunanensis]|uniref:Helix-turn-helix transcriptional regulator n=1 Tax=Shouchella hunanensis TaxID=766894 RepID=A0ABY7WDE5_9BACI|nr:helix-turn-helix transcriptional regulator [Shouchella hunanensis]WDF05516.1 helix-turn-helix transcriptional regulator [Shouchella hunanensis]
MASFKERLRQTRKEKNFTQQDVANHLGITVSAYGFYEQGRNEPSLETIKKIANKFDVSSAYLLGETDDPHSAKLDDVNSAYYNIDNLNEEEKEFLDEQLELFRRIRQNRINKENK